MVEEIIKFENCEVIIKNVKRCRGINKAIGLMFKDKNTNALLFEFNDPINERIHSLFCNPFLAIWLDENNEIIETRLIDRVGIYKPKFKFFKLLEVPLNKNYMPTIEILLDKRKI